MFNDPFRFNVPLAGKVMNSLGLADEPVEASASRAAPQVRLTFTSSEVGNGSDTDSNTMANQDGGLAVRLRAENGSGGLVGPTIRIDDEGTTFGSNGTFTYDVRDLVSGVQRGDHFNVVELGTNANDVFDESGAREAYYINAGMGDDRLTGGQTDDFLVGGAGNDRLAGGAGSDSFIGGGGNDRIAGGGGQDLAIFNVETDGADRVNLGSGSDIISVAASTAIPQVRLTFTSSEVGNGFANDSNTMANQDGGLAVRLQAENGSGGLVGPTSRFDDEGIRFESNGAFTFDVRDLVSGVQRGAMFDTVELGTNANDVVDESGSRESYYINAGMDDDRLTGGRASDFLVGGAGNDRLNGGAGDDSFIGGGGNDRIAGGGGQDLAILTLATEGADRINLGSGSDTVSVAAPATAGQVRLTFTSAEVGDDLATDSDTMANQDGGLAVRLQAEDGAGNLAGLVSRTDDEGISFVSTTPGVTFDVRDLVSGVQRGDTFDVVELGTKGNDRFDESGESKAYYINAGMGDDRLAGGRADDFLVGGAGNDRLNGRAGDDALLGGADRDTFVFSGATGSDRILDFVSGTDRIDLSAFGVDFGDLRSTEDGADTLIDVNSDNDAAYEFQIRLVNAGAPVESDFVFV